MTRYSRYIRFFSIASDFILLNICFAFVFHLKHHGFFHPFLSLLLYINLSWIVLVVTLKPYNVTRTSTYFKVLRSTLSILLGHVLLVFAYYVFQQPYRYSRELLLLFYLFFSGFLLFYQTLFFLVIKWARLQGYNYRNIIIISGKDAVHEISEYFASHPEYGYHIKHVFNSEEFDPKTFQQTLAHYCAQQDIHEIFCSLSSTRQDLIPAIMDFAEIHLIKIKLVADYKGFAFNGLEIENYSSSAVIKMHITPLDEWDKQLLKRAFDVFFSLAVIVFILSWLIPILAILIKLDSKGPVFFKQLRTGRDNKPFTCIKLRSMMVNKESDTLQATKNDTRITKLGRILRQSSLDEMPQFLNVFMGSMSVVGPRPHMLKHTKDFTEEIDNFMVRHHIKPGITGLAQTKGFRGETNDFAQLNNRVKYDLYYVKHWSFWMDIRIIASNILLMFKKNQA